jgi:hypothetical protein
MAPGGIPIGAVLLTQVDVEDGRAKRGIGRSNQDRV